MDKSRGRGDRSYVDENNGIDVELVRLNKGREVLLEVRDTAKIGKCFHTGNMGFPPVKNVEDEDWLKWEARIWNV
jgi:hypothetical protein